MKINLYINFYIDSNNIRQEELNFSVNNNINNKLIDKIFLFIEPNIHEYCLKTFNSNKVKYIIDTDRPTYNTYFSKTIEYPNRINIIANADIYFDNTLSYLKNYKWNGSEVFALSRWDLIDDNTITLYDEPCSQDAWIFLGTIKEINGADFTCGILGCDNSIAHLIKKDGFDISNPSKTIKAIHVHNSNIRNYVRDIKDDKFQRINEPYLFLGPKILI